MKQTYFIVWGKSVFTLLLLLCFSTSFAQCPNIIWQDEFSGSSLDLNKWNYQIGDGCAEGICGWGNNELQSYQQDNITVSNGTLKITARKERVKGSQFTSGRINSKNKGDFTYGRFEASIKLPAGDGLWPAFWMLSTDEYYGGWPQSGEIDIMEFVASQQDQTLGYMHYGDPYPNNQSQGNTYKLKNGVFPDAFHEFAVEWEPGEVRWYVDGILFSTKTSADIAPYNWPFDKDFHFLLNVAVGGNLGGTVDANMLPATMEVDYIRVYDGFKPSLGGDDVVSNQENGVHYSIANLGSNVNVNWSVPAGSTIVSGQGTSEIIVDFGTESGIVSANFNDGCSTKTLSLAIEVEPPYTKEYSFENFDDPGNATYASSTGVLTEVSNPAAISLNPSALSGKYDRSSQEQYDILVYDVTTISDASLYVDKSKKFYMDVYTNAPVGTQIIIQLETADATASNYPTGRHSRYFASVKENGNWSRLEFSLLDQPDPGASNAGVSKMIILYDSNSFNSDTYYFDNLDSYIADTAGTTNQNPSVSITNPIDNSTYSQGTNLSIDVTASDADGTVSQVEFFVDGNSVGVDASSPYSQSWTVVAGSSIITAVATDNGGATTTSAAVTVNGQSTAGATSLHVDSIITGTADGGKGKKYGTATVTVKDDIGNVVANTNVNGTFYGSFSEQGSAITNSSGVAVITTQTTSKGSLTVDFCVDSINHAALTYNSADNNITCTGSAQATTVNSLDTNYSLSPNPASNEVQVVMKGNNGGFYYKLYDFNGQLVLEQKGSGEEFKFDISNLRQGIYFLKILDDFNRENVLKIYKK